MGSTCYLSAHSGLPALSVPAGFTDDGLPIGVEFLGRAWSESALLNLAYDWDQSSKLRRPPFSAPALVNGKAPAPVSFTTKYATFTFDPVTAELKYDVRVDADDVLLVALHRGKKDAKGPIIARLIERGGTRGTGAVTLGSREREALANGTLYLRVYTRSQPLGGPVINLGIPRRLRGAE
jgi:amidase